MQHQVGGGKLALKARGDTMTAASLQIIHDEHAALRAMLHSLSMMLDRGRATRRNRFSM
jgi:hypothetical protein